MKVPAKTNQFGSLAAITNNSKVAWMLGIRHRDQSFLHRGSAISEFATDKLNIVAQPALWRSCANFQAAN
jgi:hypothetical protein